MKKEEKKFCRYCGTKKVIYAGSLFDEKTGERTTFLGCPKVGCEGYCDAVGHDWKRFTWGTCKRCGYHLHNY